MTALDRDRQLLATFTHLADTLVADYDVVELVQQLVDTCRDHLDVSAAGLLLADGGGQLELVASTSEASTVVEALLFGASGPAQASYDTGRVVSVDNIGTLRGDREPFRRVALEEGYGSVVAIPLRLRDTTIGALNLLQDRGASLPQDDFVIARALADIATIGILHERRLRETQALSRQLQHALNSRVVIEQAKGVVSHTKGVPIDDAFDLIRSYARSHGEHLGDVALRIVKREIILS